MASLRDRIEEDMKAALRAGEALKLSTLRMAESAIHNKEIQLLKKETGLSDSEIVDVLREEVKKRRDAAEEYLKAGRGDLSKKEGEEAGILSVYLPSELSDQDLERILKDGIREVAASGEKDFGKVMKVVMPILKGNASGDRISAMLKKLLS